MRMMRLILLFNIVLGILTSSVFAQEKLPQKIDKLKALLEVDSLRKSDLEKMKLIATYEIPCLYTIGYFPELKNAKIEFVSRKLKTTMAARPRWDFIFKRQEARVYQVVFNPDTLSNAIMFDALPFNAQIGIIAHEYSHITDYLEMSNFELLLFGIKYAFSPKFKAEVEHRVDKLAISKGFGWQLHEFTDFVLEDETIPEEYKEYKRTYYLSPGDIMDTMEIVKEEEL